MNLDRQPNLTKRNTEEILSRMVFNLANQLSANRWRQARIREVKLVREISESVGKYIDEAGIAPIVTNVAVEFFGHIETIEDEEGERDEITDYHIVSTVRQHITKDDIPKDILDKIFNPQEPEAEDDEDDDVDGDGVEVEYLSPVSVLDAEEGEIGLDEIDITRHQSVEYIIDSEGIIRGYYLSFQYYFDKVMVHEVMYTNQDVQRKKQETMTIVVNGQNNEIRDWRPIELVTLTDELIEGEAKEIDDDLLQFRIAEVLTLGAQDMTEHRRRAMSMIAMVSSGILTMKQLTTKL